MINEKNLKNVKLFLHTFQNIAHLLEPKTKFDHCWGGRGGGVSMSLTRNNPIFFFLWSVCWECVYVCIIRMYIYITIFIHITSYLSKHLSSLYKGRAGSLPSHQLLWFLANIFLDPGFEPKIQWVFYPHINWYCSYRAFTSTRDSNQR